MAENINNNSRRVGKEYKATWSTDEENIFIETWTDSVKIDLTELILEKERLTLQLQPLTDAEYIEIGKSFYHEENAQARLDEINEEIAKYG